MNKRERVFLCAALLCASGWMSASAAEDPQRVTWVLSGAEGMRYIEVGVPADNDSVPAEKFQREERPAETASESLPAETLRQETVSGSPAAGEMPPAKAPEPVAKEAPVKAAVPGRAKEAHPATEKLVAATPAEKEESTEIEPVVEDELRENGAKETEEAFNKAFGEIAAAEGFDGGTGLWDNTDEKQLVERTRATLPLQMLEASSEEKEDRDNETPGASISIENPMLIRADSMQYNGVTGNVNVQGNVVITHMMDQYLTEVIYGNSNTQEYVLPNSVKWIAPGNVMTAAAGRYNGKTNIAYFEKISGWTNGKYYYQGDHGMFNRTENKAVVTKGYFTTKHAIANVPDYRIEADRVDIYPKDHYTAHNAKLFFKNTPVITLSSYTGSLKNGASIWSLIPTPTYSSDDGWGLKNRFHTLVGGAESDVYFDARLAWYSKVGFKPDIGFGWHTAPGLFRFRYAKEESTVNDDNVWVDKWPTFSFDSRNFYIPRTNFYVGAKGEIGKWTEDRISGSHMQWNVYLGHTPITLGPHLKLSARLGYLRDYYGYNDSIRRNRYYSLGLRSSYGIFSSWITYVDNNQKGRTPYHFDTYDMDKPVYTGVRIQATPKDAFSLSCAIDTVNGKLDHRYYTYYRDMHSFYGWIQYDSVDDDFEFMIQPKDFSF